jgi:DNA polymerase-3 subunit gamma/tau
MEKFIVSARKYRPQTFDTVVGQQHITTTLKNAIRTGHLAHAFLFCGPRGVGKTTCARILAKTINCEISVEGEACDTCHSCKSFNEGTSMNIHELDAASNNSVDDIRALVDQVRFAPQAGRYKVYIIDEVHMLSSSAFNAFLKTLEEPPSYAIFILATTEKHKIIPTILSRCQIFDFKRITLQDTVAHLAGIAQKEKIETDEAALQLISQKSEGCMRDALSILDKIVSFTNGQVTYDHTIEHLNILDADYYFRLIDCMMSQDLAGAMLLYDDIDKKGFEGDMVLNGLSDFMRNVLICKDERVAKLLEVVDSFKNRFASLAAQTDTGYLVSTLNILNDAETNFKTARNKRLHVELTLIKLCYLKQALRLSTEVTGIEKASYTDKAKTIAFKNIVPIAITSVSSSQIAVEKTKDINSIKGTLPKGETTLFIEKEKKQPSPPINGNEYVPVQPLAANQKNQKISSLESLRKQVGEANGTHEAVDHPLEEKTLTGAWMKYIDLLKESKNPAWQSYESAKWTIVDSSKFEVTVTNKLQKKFLEVERKKACAFFQKELGNKAIQFTIVMIEAADKHNIDIPLSSKEQYQKIIEQFPLVKELKERLRLQLDY